MQFHWIFQTDLIVSYMQIYAKEVERKKICFLKMQEYRVSLSASQALIGLSTYEYLRHFCFVPSWLSLEFFISFVIFNCFCPWFFHCFFPWFFYCFCPFLLPWYFLLSLSFSLSLSFLSSLSLFFIVFVLFYYFYNFSLSFSFSIVFFWLFLSFFLLFFSP